MLERDKWYTTEEIAQEVGVNVQTVRRWVRIGRLPAKRSFVGGRYKLLGADVLDRVGDLEEGAPRGGQ